MKSETIYTNKVPSNWTSIEYVIEAFSTVLKHYENEVSKKEIVEWGFICHTADKYGFYIRNVFNKFRGYYKHYVSEVALRVPIGLYAKTKQYIQWKIKFLKTEIKSLNNLLKQGYTHI